MAHTKTAGARHAAGVARRVARVSAPPPSTAARPRGQREPSPGGLRHPLAHVTCRPCGMCQVRQSCPDRPCAMAMGPSGAASRIPTHGASLHGRVSQPPRGSRRSSGEQDTCPARGPTPALTCVALRRTTPMHTEHDRPRSPLVRYAPFLLHSCLMLVEEQYAYIYVLNIPRMILRVTRKIMCYQ